MTNFTYDAQNESDTATLGRALAETLPDGAVVALTGTLGAGKTRLVQAIADASGIDRRDVVSPTFVLIQEHHGRRSVYHIDAYRIRDEDEFEALGPEEYFDRGGLVLIEWADRVYGSLPSERVEIRVEVTGDQSRRFEIVGLGEPYKDIPERLRAALPTSESSADEGDQPGDDEDPAADPATHFAGPSDDDLDEIIWELDTAGRKLPVDAIRRAREHRDLMVPKLIEVLRKASAEAREGDLPEGRAAFFAFFLLTEFQAKEALPAILEAVSLPGDLPFDLFGDDTITSMLARVLVALAGDQPELLDAMIRDQSLNDYVRWEAAQAFFLLVRDRRIPRDAAVERLRLHLREAIDREDVAIIGPLICELNSYSPKEAMGEIEEAYRRHLVETFLVDLGTVQTTVAEGESAFRRWLERAEPTGIEDTIAELENWAAFREEPPKRPLPRRLPAVQLPSFRTSPAMSLPDTPKPAARVGRNDPCPCGSGKKFKKCCGAPDRQ